MFSPKKFFGWKKLFEKLLGPKKNVCRMKFGARIFESTKIMLAKKWVPLSLIKIGDMDKCCQGICCLDKCHHNSKHLLNMVPSSFL